MGLIYEAGSPIIDNFGWSTAAIHMFSDAWLEEEVQHKGQLAKTFVVYTDWRNAEAEKDFKYESGRDFTKFFRAPGTSTEGLQWEDTATYEDFLKHLSPLGYEQHYVAFERIRGDDFKDKGCWCCMIQ